MLEKEVAAVQLQLSQLKLPHTDEIDNTTPRCLVGNGGMIMGTIVGDHIGTTIDPFPHSLLSTRETKESHAGKIAALQKTHDAEVAESNCECTRQPWRARRCL